MSMKSINPATGETLKTFETLSDAGIDAALSRSVATFRDFSPRRRLGERTQWLNKAADILVRDKAKFAKMMTLEMGKPIAQAEAEVEKCAGGCRHYAENAERYLANSHTDTGKEKAYVRWLPIGPVLAVMPWNFPFWQVFRFGEEARAPIRAQMLEGCKRLVGIASASAIGEADDVPYVEHFGRARWKPRGAQRHVAQIALPTNRLGAARKQIDRRHAVEAQRVLCQLVGQRRIRRKVETDVELLRARARGDSLEPADVEEEVALGEVRELEQMLRAIRRDVGPRKMRLAGWIHEPSTAHRGLGSSAQCDAREMSIDRQRERARSSHRCVDEEANGPRGVNHVDRGARHAQRDGQAW